MTQRIRLPEEVAQLLIEEGVAQRRPPARSGVVDLIVEGASGAAVVVTLLQAPSAMMSIARAVQKLAGRRQRTIELRVKGPNGEIHIADCTADTPLEELTEIIRKGLLD